jgi:hypothetical protein
MGVTLTRPVPVELGPDRAFGRRVRRLGWVSLVALGIIWWLGAATLRAPPFVDVALAGGWGLMPATLFASLAAPRLRYGLVVPASLVGGALLAICAWWLPPSATAAAGWVLIAAGVGLGALQGLWFWFRLLPVPSALDAPFAPGRWALIAVHISLIVAGMLLAATAL